MNSFGKKYSSLKKVAVAFSLGIALIMGANETALAAVAGTSLNTDAIKKALKDSASQMVAEANASANQAYHEYLAEFPSGKVSNLQVIDRSLDSVTLYWSNETVKNAQFFKVDYWMVSNANARNTVYVTKPASTTTSVAIDNSVSVFQLSGLSQGEYTVQITVGNYDANSSDGRRYEKNALGILVNSYSTIQVAPAPVVPTEVNFRYLQDGYCSVKVDGVNSVDQTYGVEAELYDCYKDKKITTFSKDSYQRATAVDLKSDKIVNNRFYGIRARAYLVAGSTKVYSDWTDYNYAGSKMSSITTSQKKKKINVKWKAVKGATNYTVYISKSKNSGYKKVTTTKDLTKTISKYNGKALKSDNIYYVKVVANYKHGGDNYKVESVAKRVTIS